MTAWQAFGQYQFEYNKDGYTGWYRCADGRMADGRWPEWNCKTDEVRYR